MNNQSNLKVKNGTIPLVAYSLWLFIALNALTPLIGAYSVFKYNTALYEQTEEASNALMFIAQQYDNIGTLIGLSFLLSAIIYSFWIFRVSSNSRCLNPDVKIKFTPGWSVLSYFIPFLSVYWPYKSMKELWQLNVKTTDNGIILGWWISFLFLNSSTMACSKIDDPSVIGYQWYVGLITVSNILGIVSAFLALKIIKQINDAQSAGLRLSPAMPCPN
ncbi:DUF4328 domain-containing protein [Legionella genomosp. 1]|uniref:DUF4328 domain-containing protein n=1 Tax=Legionella genomosp. 1 TaxID=1093625 RepID=UPI001056A469|nr:DUF4328 domain-containing protein [Legionella genomosp. 1]